MESLSVQSLLDLLETVLQPDERIAVHAEISRRAQSPHVAEADVTTADSIMRRSVQELRDAGWCELADACLIMIAASQHDTLEEALLTCVYAARWLNLQAGPACDHHRCASPGAHAAEPGVGDVGPDGLATWIVGCARKSAAALQFQLLKAGVTPVCRGALLA